MTQDIKTLCPSAQPDFDEAVLFAVVGGTAAQPEVAYLDKIYPITEAVLQMAGDLDPTEVFRFAAPCINSECHHFHAAQATCQLAAKVVKLVPLAVNKLAPCAIRQACRWWQQEGVAGCQRCPQVVTLNYAPTDAMRAAATPDSAPSADGM